MIYLVTNNDKLKEYSFKVIGIDESLSLLQSVDILQADSETTGVCPQISKLLCFQLGNKEKDFQIIIDCQTIDIRKYKDILESKYLIFHTGKFDLQFLYNYSIIPRKVYDTMIVEQFLHLGYPSGIISYSLKEIAWRRLGIDIDKSIREEIHSRGLDEDVIKYAALDVVYLEDIMKQQIQECKDKKCIIGAKLECDFVPSIAYLEWCGIKLDENKWKAKMEKDQKGLIECKEALDDFCINNPLLQEYVYVNKQGDLFDGWDDAPKCRVNWSSPKQVVTIARKLGFNTTVEDKKTGGNKESVLEKHIKTQKGINDEFIKLYFDYQEKSKVVSTYGQSQLNMINPVTGRCHTIYRQLGCDSGKRNYLYVCIYN